MKLPPTKQARCPSLLLRTLVPLYSATKVMSGRLEGWDVRYFIVESAALIHLNCSLGVVHWIYADRIFGSLTCPYKVRIALGRRYTS